MSIAATPRWTQRRLLRRICGGAEDDDVGAAIDETEGVLQRDKQRSFGKEAAFLIR
jgi:hypothetical protein